MHARERNTNTEHLLREERLIGDGHAIVQIVDDDGGALHYVRFDSEVVDLNAYGIRITADTPIAGASVDCLIKVRHVQQRFFLMGEVRWASIDASGDVQLGIEFVEHPTTNLEDWRNLFT